MWSVVPPLERSYKNTYLTTLRKNPSDFIILMILDSLLGITSEKDRQEYIGNEILIILYIYNLIYYFIRINEENNNLFKQGGNIHLFILFDIQPQNTYYN